MFKNNLNTLNLTKDKQINYNYTQSNKDNQNPLNYHHSNYQFKANINQNPSSFSKEEIASNAGAYSNPLSPLSPCVNKNPISPTSKIKMFSNVFTLTKKSSLNTNNIAGQNFQQNTHDQIGKQAKIFNKIVGKNLILNLNESIDLKCDQVLEDMNTQQYDRYKKQTLQDNISQQNNNIKKLGNKISVLNFEVQIENLKCDEILQIKKNDIDNKSNYRFNHINSINNNLQNNFISTNLQINNFNLYQKNYHHINKNCQKKKTHAIINTNKNTDRSYHANNSSNTIINQNNLQKLEKPRSFTNILSPTPQGKIFNHQKNQPEPESNQTQSIHSTSTSIQKTNQDQKQIFERMRTVLEIYKKKIDEKDAELSLAKQKNQFLEKENFQLKKCLHDEGSNRALTHHLPNPSGRYQGVK